jgi:succinate dehydrogenase / fumarate reductase membrane anchor subunit
MIGVRRGSWSWLLQRVTGVYLVIGIVVHFWVLHYSGDPLAKEFQHVAHRLSRPGWFLFDLSLLFAALYHGLNGIYNIILDFNIREGARKVVGWILWWIGVIASGLGIWILTSFAR